MAVERWSDVLTLIACVVGLVVVVLAWPRRKQSHRADRLRHPSPPPPIAVKLDTIGDAARWRVANRHAILNATIEIVTFRRTGSEDPWVSEPIVEPIRLSPGRSTTLPTVVPDTAVAYDVVVAWTLHHLGDDVQDRRTFTIDPNAFPPPVPAVVPVAGPVRGLRVVYGVIAVLLCAGTLLAAWRLADPPDGVSSATSAPPDTSQAPASVETPTTMEPSAPATSLITAVPATVATPTTSATSAGTAPPPAGTTVPSTTSTTTSSTTTSTTTSSTSSTTTSTTTAPTTTVPGDPRRVDITGRVADCRFGPDCLIASFALIGFPDEGDYVCEFADGTRFTFRYDGSGAVDACSTSGTSITVEVDGVRSATITRDSLGGT
ncbi:hypothetical protein [Ilumatobacter sp.]|uniref:hypothetical protein n=1 Tax=Ilumatobacter sp. TaxID=1967498 RepID=UPI003AF4D72B